MDLPPFFCLLDFKMMPKALIHYSYLDQAHIIWQSLAIEVIYCSYFLFCTIPLLQSINIQFIYLLGKPLAKCINLVLRGVNPWLNSLRLLCIKYVSNAWTDVRYFLLGCRKENGSDSTARWRTCATTLSHRWFVPLALSTSFVVLLSDTCFSPLLFLFDKERWICFQINFSLIS